MSRTPNRVELAHRDKGPIVARVICARCQGDKTIAVVRNSSDGGLFLVYEAYRAAGKRWLGHPREWGRRTVVSATRLQSPRSREASCPQHGPRVVTGEAVEEAAAVGTPSKPRRVVA
jgi:hypothetical protein